MARPLSQLPILPELYERALLKPASSALFPANDAINRRVGIFRGDITRLKLDAIVNAANESLLGGGGVDGAIHRAAGRQLVRECESIGGCPTGEARITAGYNLPAKHVIHTVGPRYALDHNPEDLLRSCYQKTLELAVSSGVRTLAFSGISTGIYGFPSDGAAKIACETVRKFLESSDGDKILRVVFVTFMDKDVEAYNSAIPKYFPPN
ncbi:LRP16 family protein [Mariannaea sp. PMI_226]|nr:LRP16 family protein [Mariannaea sp. PMI_226]